MADTGEMYAAFDELDRALRARYLPALAAEGERLGVSARHLGVLMAVLAWDPQPTTAWMFGVRGPYAAIGVYAGWLADAAGEGLLVEGTDGAYRVTERGRRVYRSLIDGARQSMEPRGAFDWASAERLADLMQALVEACLAAPSPPGKDSLRASRFHYPGAAAPVMGRIDQWLTDLRAFRDDAHLSAWQSTGVSAPALEALTLLWRGQAAALDEVCEQLRRRGQSRDVYAAALEELRARGWLEGADAAPRLTAAGREMRNLIEQRTDELFFRPWHALAPADLDELHSLTLKVSAALAQAA